MKVKRVCRACAITGLTACVHLTVLLVNEAAHPHQSGAWPAITSEVDALPIEPDHTHRDYDRAVRILDVNRVVTTSSGGPPPGRFVAGLEPYRRPHYPAASFVFVPPPELLASGSSSWRPSGGAAEAGG